MFDRTHLRFFTRKSIHELFDYLGFSVIEDRATPALAQSAAPLLRRMFESDLAEGNHLALEESRSYRIYNKAVQPLSVYLGTLGMKGAYDAMRTGYVDETWAKEHHELWYEGVKAGTARQHFADDAPAEVRSQVADGLKA